MGWHQEQAGRLAQISHEFLKIHVKKTITEKTQMPPLVPTKTHLRKKTKNRIYHKQKRPLRYPTFIFLVRQGLRHPNRQKNTRGFQRVIRGMVHCDMAHLLVKIIEEMFQRVIRGMVHCDRKAALLFVFRQTVSEGDKGNGSLRLVSHARSDLSSHVSEGDKGNGSLRRCYVWIEKWLA